MSYTIERNGDRVTVRGSIPVSEFAALTKIWDKEGLKAMALGVTSALGVTLAICRDSDVEAWEAEIAANAKIKASGDAEMEWLLGHDTGTSSKVIFSILASTSQARSAAMARLHGWRDTPSDPSDFGRCHRLLDLFPAWRERLGEVAAKHPAWAPLVEAWDELTALWNEESPTKNCPKLYNRMKELLKRAA